MRNPPYYTAAEPIPIYLRKPRRNPPPKPPMASSTSTSSNPVSVDPPAPRASSPSASKPPTTSDAAPASPTTSKMDTSTSSNGGSSSPERPADVPLANPQSRENGHPEPSATDPEVLKEQGNFYFKEKEYDVAVDLYTQAIGTVTTAQSIRRHDTDRQEQPNALMERTMQTGLQRIWRRRSSSLLETTVKPLSHYKAKHRLPRLLLD